MIDLSLNEAESLAVKVALGAGYSWGVAEDIGRAARMLARRGAPWAEALSALVQMGHRLEQPSSEQVLQGARGHPLSTSATALCPVCTALLMMDAGVDLAAGPLRLERVGMPIWIEGLLLALNPTKAYQVDYREGGALSPECDVTISASEAVVQPLQSRRAPIRPELLAALQKIAHRTYVPESERSRARGAGGGSVDGE